MRSNCDLLNRLLSVPRFLSTLSAKSWAFSGLVLVVGKVCECVCGIYVFAEASCEVKCGIFARRAMADQACEGLCY